MSVIQSNLTSASSSSAFLFDMDGVLIDSHTFQVEALLHAMRQLDQSSGKKPTRASDDTRYNTLKSIVTGGTEQSAVAGIQKHFPEYSSRMVDLLQLAWSEYYRMTERDTSRFVLSEQRDTLQFLHDLGVPVMIVSNSKADDVKRFCKLMGLPWVVRQQLFVAAEDCKKPKPEPDCYLLAARKLGIEANKCCAIEDSVIGVQAAARAGARVIAVTNHGEKQHGDVIPHLLSAGAQVAVPCVLNAKTLFTTAYPPTELTVARSPCGLTLRVSTVQFLQTTNQPYLEKLLRETYAAYCAGFSGRTFDDWRNRICDPRDALTRVGALFHNDQVVGYAILKIRVVKYQGQDRVVLLPTATVLPKFRSTGRRLLLQYFQQEGRRAWLAFAPTEIYLFDNFLGFGGFGFVTQVFRKVFPSAACPEVPADVFAFMQSLAKEIGYRHAGTEDPLVYRSSSSVRYGSEADKAALLANPHPDCAFISRRTKLQDGHGMIAIAKISPENLHPQLKNQDEKPRVSKL